MKDDLGCHCGVVQESRRLAVDSPKRSSFEISIVEKCGEEIAGRRQGSPLLSFLLQDCTKLRSYERCKQFQAGNATFTRRNRKSERLQAKYDAAVTGVDSVT